MYKFWMNMNFRIPSMRICQRFSSFDFLWNQLKHSAILKFKKRKKKKELFSKDDWIWSEHFFSYLISCPSDKLICRSLASLTNFCWWCYCAFFISFIFFFLGSTSTSFYFMLFYPKWFSFLAFIALSLLLCVVPS